jgi:DNA mismatch repair protein MutL
VDVNIHPAKREIKIHRDFALLSAIRDEIGRALNTMDAAPNFHAGYRNSNGGAKSEAEVVYTPPPFPGAKEGTEGTAGTLAFPGAESLARQSSFTFDDSSVQAGETRDSGGNDSESGIREQPPFWQLKDRYIITSIKEGGIIVDQHAAHERILYEDYREKMHGREAESQQLLFPLTLDFTASDWDVLEPMLTFLNRIGFSIRDFGNRSVLIDAVPAGFPEITDDGRIIYEFIDEMRTHGKVSSGYIDKLAAAMACRAAIKAGAPLTVDDMRSIVDRLFATEDPFHCPHGRPTIIRLTIEDLDKRFGR